MGFAVALGWKRLRLLGVLAGLTGAYTAAAWAFQLSMFGGCAAKIGSDKHYSLDGADCFLDLHALTGLGHPRLGFAALAAGAALAILAASRAWQAHRREAALAVAA